MNPLEERVRRRQAQAEMAQRWAEHHGSMRNLHLARAADSPLFGWFHRLRAGMQDQRSARYDARYQRHSARGDMLQRRMDIRQQAQQLREQRRQLMDNHRQMRHF